jgi:hypothetical protein
MSRIERWLEEKPHRPPAEIACLLARDRFWKDERLRLIGTHPDWPDAAWLLDLDDELAHAIVLVLSRLTATRRRGFADVFYEERRSNCATRPPADARSQLSLAAAVVLQVVDLVDRPQIYSERVLDLLHGAAEGHDLTRTPAPAVEEVRKAIARIRFEVDFDDPADPQGAAALALAEVLDPSSETIALKEVLARSAWAAVETREPPQVLGFLLAVERLFADAAEALASPG